MVQGFGKVLLLAGALVWMSFAHSSVLREDIGELKIHDLLLRPNFTLQEPRQGDFSIGESSFALRWELQEKFAGVIRIGPRTLLNPLARYTSTVSDDIMLVEAYAEYNDVYGDFRLGRLPVGFGYEGRLWERNLIFPRSLLFQKRVTMLRDVGIAYDISENNWYTGFVVHNGESDSDLDGRTWLTARWGYKGDDFEIGVSGQTGSTTPKSTTAVVLTDTLAGVDPTKDEKWSMAGLYADATNKKFEWVFEAYLGQLEQEKIKTKYGSGHTDFSYQMTKRFSTHLRYDYFDPNTKISDDAETQISLALMFSNQTHSSNLILVGTKDVVQGSQSPHDAIRLIWSLSPSGVVRF